MDSTKLNKFQWEYECLFIKGFYYNKFFVTEEKALNLKILVLDPNTHTCTYTHHYAKQIYRDLKFIL